jgi:hypothetical protein
MYFVMKPSRQPPAILNQPIDYSRNPYGQAEARWKALYAHYGVDPDVDALVGVDHWRDKLICALARDCWPGFTLSRRARGKPRQVSDPLALLDVVSEVLAIEPTWATAGKTATAKNIQKHRHLITALQVEAAALERKPSITWLSHRLCAHPKSPWKGKRVETLRSSIVKNMKIGMRWHPDGDCSPLGLEVILHSTLGPSERGPRSYGLPPLYSDFFEEGTD